MKSFMTVVTVTGALTALIAGTSTAFAQANLSPPTIVRPVWNSTQTGFDSGWVGPMQVIIRKSPNAPNVSRFRLVLFRDGAGTAYMSRVFRQSEGVTEGTGPSATIRFVVQIPSSEHGFINRLSMKSCDDNDQCGNASSSEFFLVLPPAPTVSGPSNPSTVPANRSVTFSWQHANVITFPGGASSPPADYQLTFLTAAPEDIGWTSFRPEAVTHPNTSIRLFSGSNCPFTPGQNVLFLRCHTVTLPPGPTAFIWTIASCVTFNVRPSTAPPQEPLKGRRCGASSQFRTLTAPTPFAVSFSANLAPAFRHARCANCHAVKADNYQNDAASNPPGGLPSNHPRPDGNPNLTWSVARENSGQCAACHGNSLLPAEGTINPGWHTPANTRDFRNRTNDQLCQMARNPAVPDNTPPLQHLTEDKLILWAVGDGRVPDGTRRFTAPPNSIPTWRSIVQAWVNAGMPCN